MKLPLHKNASVADKLAHYADMASLNPKGFRSFSTKKGRKPTETRIDRLTKGMK